MAATHRQRARRLRATPGAHHLRGVVLQQQADMFDPTVTEPAADADYSAFRPLVQALVDESHRVRRAGVPVQRRQPPVQPGPAARAGSPWLSFYGVARLGRQPAAGSPSTARTSARPTGSR